MPLPPSDAHAAFLAPVTRHTRRVNIYEEDAVTLWKSSVDFIEGNVIVDYGRPERRAVDIVFDNTSGDLDYSPTNFWYDKIIKVYRGVEYYQTDIVRTQVSTNLIPNPSLEVNTTGYTGVNTTLSISSTWTAIGNSSLRILTSVANTDSYAHIGGDSGAIRLGMVTNKTYTIRATGYAPSWAGNTHATRARRIVVFVVAGGVTTEYTSEQIPVSTNPKRVYVTFSVPSNATQAYIRLYNGSDNTSTSVYWDAIQLNEGNELLPYSDGSQPNGSWTGTAHNSTSILYNDVSVKTFKTWDTQIGEFMIDSLNETNFPDTVRVTGRDYAKKMLSSKFSVATAFTSTDSLDVTIGSIASNAGIVASKRIIPITGKTLGRSFVFERGVSRWDACKQLAESFGYELFFDAQGNLVMRQFLDPSSSALAYTFDTGSYGNLVTYDKTVSDAQLYNHILVSGEATDTIPVWAEARNDNPGSPTNIAAIGDRYFEYVSSFITTTQQAQDVADQFLAIYSLQEYNFNFSSLMLPWMEVGEIIEFDDPKETITQPDRFLLSQINIPLTLAPMTGTGKRVTVVG